jgi:glycosyltransferase involved in cell wall biosynthesis
MKIAILAPEFIPTWGGVGIYAYSLVKELIKYDGLEIHVMTPMRGDEYSCQNIQEMFGNKIVLHYLSRANDTFIYNLRFQTAIFKEFPKLDNIYHFDLVHSMNLVHMPDIFLKITGRNIKSLVTVHSTISTQMQGILGCSRNFFELSSSEKYSVIAYPCIRTLEKLYLRKTEYVITVSQRLKRDLCRIEKYKGFIQTIPNGIDMDKFNSHDTNGSNKFAELSKKGQIVLYVGRLLSLKGIEDFVKIMDALRETKIHFVIAGHGGNNIFEKLVKKYSIDKNSYTNLGFVSNDDLPWLYKISSVFVLPSYSENFPITLLEAMAMKCPCIATDVGDIPLIIDHGKNGFLVKPGNVNQMVEYVRLIVNDKAVAQAVAQEGYAKAKTNFTSEEMARKTFDVYKMILEQSKK